MMKKHIRSQVCPRCWPTRAGRLSAVCALVSLLAWSGCKPEASTPAPPPPAEKRNVALAAEEPAAVAASTDAPAPEEPAAAAPPEAPAESAGAPAELKGMDKVIQILNWHSENYTTKVGKIPTIAQLKVWKDPNYPLGLPAWPDPPAGKKWVINSETGMFTVGNAK